MIKNKNIILFFIILIFLLFLYKNQTNIEVYNDSSKEGFIENMKGYTRPFTRFTNKYIKNYIDKINGMIKKINPFK